MRKVPPASLVAALLLIAADQATAATFRLQAPDGTVHFTNAPTDPRYRRMAGASGTVTGWLSLPAFQSSRYAAEIGETSARYGVPQRLVEAVIRIESAFNAYAVS